MSVADLKARTQQLFDTFNTRDVAAVASYFAPGAELRDIAVAAPLVGPEQIALACDMFFTAFPQGQIHVDRIIGEGDIVVAEWSGMGAHLGPIMGIPPSGKEICVKGISIITYRQRLAVGARTVWDLAGLLRQIGLLPSQL